MIWKKRRTKKPMLTLKVKKLREDAAIPERGTTGSAGLDIYSVEDCQLWPGDIRCLNTGIAMEIPNGYFGLLMTRSSMGKNGVRLSSGANIIDADYRGEIIVCLRNDGEYLWPIKKGERIAQLAIVPYLDCIMVIADELTPTMRGNGGFGSTGR